MTLTQSKSETFYEILRVDSSASQREITAAYHHAKSAYGKESQATYSLFSSEEAEALMAQLEEAYRVLSNSDLRSEYDNQLSRRHTSPHTTYFPVKETPSEGSSSMDHLHNDAQDLATHVNDKVSAQSLESLGGLNGQALLQLRESQHFTLEDVSRITKIPTRYLRALEENDMSRLPARVYIQGFLKNLIALYKIENARAEQYFENLTAKTPPPLPRVP